MESSPFYEQRTKEICYEYVYTEKQIFGMVLQRTILSLSESKKQVQLINKKRKNIYFANITKNESNQTRESSWNSFKP